jgi:photosystem II stability/assembly factor-like uncharacterized protein
MNRNRKQGKRISQLLWILISLFLLCSCLTSSSHSSGTWQVIGVFNENHSIMTAGFLDEEYVATGGVLGLIAYSSDGAKTWLQTNSIADCRYGIEIVSPEVIWTCGGATNVRKSVDGGRTWSVQAAFGDQTIKGPCHSASFLDETTGWLANSDIFGTTTDGGASWNMRTIPAGAEKIATIDTYLPGEGYLLDQNGALFFTKDDGQHWRETGQLPLGDLTISFSAYQMAAMRFSDSKHGLIVVSPGDYGNKGQMMAFHTYNGGENWISESVPVATGSVYLSRTGGYLTVITAYDQLTLLRYEE